MNSSPKLDPWIGRLIGDRQRYRLEKSLGGGAMGNVYLAMDTLLGQQVAIKLLKDTLVESEELRKRFEREVALCAALKNDNIVHVSDYGITPEGHPFYVMEYLRGQTLGQLLRREKRLDVERAVSIISQVCVGLRQAHEGITLWRDNATASEQVKAIHRDLKPDNIFLVSTSLGELVKILDFGIAKIHDEFSEYTNLTSMFIGTFRFAAPEQLVVAKDIDGRADIYSLGVILYEMLSGTDPFNLGLNVQNISGASWAVAHTSKIPQPLRSQPGCEQLSLELEAVVMRCLQKSPNERFASVDELNHALQAALGVDTRLVISAGQLVAPTITQTSPSQGEGSSGTTIKLNNYQDGTLDIPSQGQGSSDTTIKLNKYQDGTLDIPSQGQSSSDTTIKLNNYQDGKLDIPSQGQSSSDTTIARPLTPSRQGVGATIPQTPSVPAAGSDNITTSNSLPRPKSSLRVIGSGIAVALALTIGSIYYLPSFLQPIEKRDQRVEKPFSLANTLSGHSESVWSVTISPDRQFMVSGSGDKTIKIWRLETGELLRTLSGHSDAVRSVTISPDGQFMASGSGDKTIKIWRLETGELLRTLPGHSDTIWSVGISPDGQTLVSGSNDGTVKLWSVGTGKLLRTLSGHSDAVWSVALSPDGQTLASSSGDMTIKIWRLETGELLRTLSGHSDAVRSVAISPNGQTLISGSWDKTVKIWNLHNGELLRTLSGHTSRVISIAPSPDSQTIASSSQDQTIKIWRLETGELLQNFPSIHSDWVLSVAISSNGQTFVSGSKDQTIKIWRR